MITAITDFISQKRGIYGAMHVIILLLSLFLVITISIDTFNGYISITETRYLKVQFWICMFFLLDFFLEWWLSPKKLHYFVTHLVFFIISIPYLNIFRYYDIRFATETEYFMQFIPLVRGGYALAIVVGWLSYNRASSIFVSYLIMLMATVYFASLLFFILEHKVNPMVSTYGDSLWWAFMDVTTVGSNIYAVTSIGKILSVLLAALGMMMFPIFTVYITSIVQRTNTETKNLEEKDKKPVTSQ
ncbi:MAG: ion channel [Bacteroidales bacterium]